MKRWQILMATVIASCCLATRHVNSDESATRRSTFQIQGETIIATDDLKVVRITVSAPSGCYIGTTCSEKLRGGGGFQRLSGTGPTQELVWTIALHRGRHDGNRPTDGTYTWNLQHSGASSSRTQTGFDFADKSPDHILSLQVEHGEYRIGSHVKCFDLDLLKYGIRVSDSVDAFQDTQ